MTKIKRKSSNRVIYRRKFRPTGTQYIRKGKINQISRGSGFLNNLIKGGKKLLKSKTAKKLLSTARKELGKKKNQKIIIKAANKVLDKLDQRNKKKTRRLKNKLI